MSCFINFRTSHLSYVVINIVKRMVLIWCSIKSARELLAFMPKLPKLMSFQRFPQFRSLFLCTSQYTYWGKLPSFPRSQGQHVSSTCAGRNSVKNFLDYLFIFVSVFVTANIVITIFVPVLVFASEISAVLVSELCLDRKPVKNFYLD